VSTNGEYLGGAIAPGIDSSADGLFRSAAQIGRVELVAPPSAIGKTTVTCVQSGIIYGSAGMIDGLIDRITDELGTPVRVVATGGRASTVVEHCRLVEQVEPALTLHGLLEIYERNSEE
jgi:type III pantothenate kinase